MERLCNGAQTFKCACGNRWPGTAIDHQPPTRPRDGTCRNNTTSTRSDSCATRPGAERPTGPGTCRPRSAPEAPGVRSAPCLLQQWDTGLAPLHHPRQAVPGGEVVPIFQLTNRIMTLLPVFAPAMVGRPGSGSKDGAPARVGPWSQPSSA